MNFNSYFNKLQLQVDSWIEELAVDTKAETLEAGFYILCQGGKRIRPVLCLAVAESFGISGERLRSYCLGIEVLHAASLIHDDLPALDDDDERRGEPSCHRQFGEALAVLAGDALQNYAISIILRDESLTSDQRAGLALILAEAGCRISEGQAKDIKELSSPLQLEKSEILKEVLRCYELKTGALFQAAICGPLVLLSDKEKDFHQPMLRSFSQHFGLLFQLTDDLLDLSEVNSDLSQSLSDLLLAAYGETGIRELCQHEYEAAHREISNFPGDKTFFIQILDKVLKRDI